MSWKIETLPNFIRELKPLQKKYPSLKHELQALMADLLENPTQGTAMGNNCYKIRLAIKSKGRGKSGGARVVTCVALVAERLVMLSIYDKSEQANINDGLLFDLVRQTGI